MTRPTDARSDPSAPAQPQQPGGRPASPKSKLCDCELSHNGLGMIGRECDCPAGQPQQPDGEDMLHDRVARDIHDALGWAYTEQEWSQPRYRTKLDAAARAAIAAVRAHERWQCAARRSGTAGGNDPADCDWPHCGCDNHATKVLQSLEEEGLDPDSVRARALEEAALKATSFLVGDPANGVPLRNPMAHEIADAIHALIAAPLAGAAP